MGRPWQFYRKVTYDGYKNTYSFTWNKKSIILAPLKPTKAYKDQFRIPKQCKIRAKEKKVHKGKNKRKKSGLSLGKKKEDYE